MTENVIQFGTGAFLRGFADWMLEVMNERCGTDFAAVCVQSTSGGLCNAINNAPMYTLTCRGLEDGKEVSRNYEIRTLSRCINANEDYDAFLSLAKIESFKYVISNTTEAGIKYNPTDKKDTPAESFPAKLTQLLFRRYELGLSGFTVLPCELIEANGDNLKAIVLRYADEWQLGNNFIKFVNRECDFRNTLVDRIVTGFDSSLGSENPLTNSSELYHLWVIEGEKTALPFAESGLNVVYTDNLDKYRARKVRILNGAHTCLIPYALLEGEATVLDAISNETLAKHLEGCLAEILETLDTLYAKDELVEYANEVINRFKNPFIKHRCESIALNSVSKFRVRVLPSMKAYFEKFGKPAVKLSTALMKLIEFYKTATPKDDENVIAFIKANTVSDILTSELIFGEDITKYVEANL